MNYYKVGGSLKYGHPTYITRGADLELYNALKSREFCYVLNCRQMGKSSLRVKTMKTLIKEGINCGAIDLGILGGKSTAEEQWYGGLVAELWRKFKLSQGINDDLNWWKAHQYLSPLKRCDRFISDILLTKITTEIIIFLDEVDSIINFEFRDDFFSLIRNCYEQRTEDDRYSNLTFCLFGVADSATLRNNKQATPFNIGRHIKLSGFSLMEAQPLLSGLQDKTTAPDKILAEIIDHTRGQPFLTQKLCYIVARQAINSTPNLQQLVQKYIIDNWESQDEPEHLKTIRDRLLYNGQDKARLLGLYQKILQQGSIKTDDSEEQVELCLSGLVIKEQDQKQQEKLVVRNPIYRQIFDLNWVDQQLAAISPYQAALATWLKSNRQDQSRLLRGKALLEGQDWAKKHSISPQEKEFIRQGEQLAQEEAKKAQLAQRTEIAENKLAQEKKIARWQRLSLVSFMLLIGILLFKSHQTSIEKIKALTQSSKALYTSQQQLDALVTAIAAKKQLKSLWQTNPDLASQTDSTLHQIIYTIQEYSRLLGHEDSVFRLAVSPDGSLIASGSKDRTVKIWRKTKTGWQQYQTLSHGGWVIDVAISKDNNLIASASRDRTVKIWHRNGKMLNTLGHPLPVTAVAIFPDNSTIVSGSDNGEIRIWHHNKLINAFKGHSETIQSLAISPDGNYIVSASEDKAIKIWRKDGTLINTLKGHTEGVRAIAIYQDKIISASRDQTLKIWDFNGQLLTTLKGHIAPVYGVDIHPQTQEIVSASADNTIKIWNFAGVNLATLKGHTNRVWDVAYSADGSSIISTSWDKTIRLWQPHNNFVNNLSQHQDVVIALDYSKQYLASASDDKTVKLWHHDGRLINTLKGHTGEVYDVAIHPQESIVASVGADKTIRLWQTDGTLIHTLKGHDAAIWAVAIARNQIISGSNDNTVKIWDFQGDLLHTLKGHQRKVWDVAVNPPGDKIISSSEDNTLKIWDFQGNLLHTLEGHTDSVRTAAYSQDNKWIVSGSEDRTLKIWTTEGELITTLQGHRAAIKDISISPDNRLIASVSDSGEIILWEHHDHTWKQIQTIQQQGNSVWSIAFSPDGKTLATAMENSQITLWSLETILQLNPLEYGCEWIKQYQECK
ncbi:MAG: AAA-like domain-containing protein [Cyanobacteria bacterium J06621_8]